MLAADTIPVAVSARDARRSVLDGIGREGSGVPCQRGVSTAAV
jgi:hypothetical protein